MTSRLVYGTRGGVPPQSYYHTAFTLQIALHPTDAQNQTVLFFPYKWPSHELFWLTTKLNLAISVYHQ